MPWQRFEGRAPEGSMRRTPIDTAFIRGWDGGWTPDVAEAMANPNSIVDLQDVEWTEGFGLKKRNGYEIITDAVSGTAEITSVHVGTSDGGTWDIRYGFPLDASSVGGGTATIDWDASAAEVKTAIEAIANPPVDIEVSVTGTGQSGDPWLITMTSPIAGLVVTGDGTDLTNGTLTLAQSQQGLTALGAVSDTIIKSVEVLEPGTYPRYTQIVFYINEADGHIFYERMGELIVEEEQPGSGSDLARSGYALGPWVRANGERPYSVQAATWGRGIYITSQRVGGSSSNGTTTMTHDDTTDTHTKPLFYNADDDTWSVVEPHDLDGDTAGFPTARCLVSAYDRMFAANVVKQEGTGDYRWRSRIYWSVAGTAETWNTNNYITVGSEDDGTDIVNLTRFREQILIFKEQSVWALTGTDEDTFTLYALTNLRGAAGTYAATADEKHCYFFDSSEGLIRYDGANFVNISEPVNETLLAEFNPAAYFKVVVWQDRDKVYCSIPTGTLSTDKPDVTYVWDKRLETWTRWNIAFVGKPEVAEPDRTVSWTDDDLFDNEYYGGIPDVTGLARLNSTSSDNGTAIDAHFETAWFNPGDVGDKHRIRRLEVLAQPDGDAVDVALYRDFSQSSFGSGSFTPTGSLDGYHDQSPNYTGTWWTWLKARFDNDTDAETFQIDGVGMSYSTRNLKRNDLGVN